MFAVVDLAARISWSAIWYFSSLGRVGTTSLTMNNRSSRHSFQHSNSSNGRFAGPLRTMFSLLGIRALLYGWLTLVRIAPIVSLSLLVKVDISSCLYIEFSFRIIFTSADYYKMFCPTDFSNQWLEFLLALIRKIKLTHIPEILSGKSTHTREFVL